MTGPIHARRRPHNRFGFALQLCALRYPGRLLLPGEIIPEEVTRFLAAQLGLNVDDLLEYASREETRHEHLAALRQLYGYRAFTGQGARELKLWLVDQGEIRDRTTEGQHYRMAGLNLLTAIVIYWNTARLGEAVHQRKQAGLPTPPELLAHTSPLGWAHILLTGEYRWSKKR